MEENPNQKDGGILLEWLIAFRRNNWWGKKKNSYEEDLKPEDTLKKP